MKESVIRGLLEGAINLLLVAIAMVGAVLLMPRTQNLVLLWLALAVVKTGFYLMLHDGAHRDLFIVKKALIELRQQKFLTATDWVSQISHSGIRRLLQDTVDAETGPSTMVTDHKVLYNLVYFLIKRNWKDASIMADSLHEPYRTEVITCIEETPKV